MPQSMFENCFEANNSLHTNQYGFKISNGVLCK